MLKTTMKTKRLIAGMLCLTTIIIAGCDSSSGDTQNQNETTTDAQPSRLTLNNNIRVNQVGYQPQASKIGVVPDTTDTSFNIIDSSTNAVVFTGQLSQASSWSLSGSEQLKKADFSEFTIAGEYRLSTANLGFSTPFKINADVYNTMLESAIKAYYLSRASTELPESYAGKWHRPAAHLDNAVYVHSSAATLSRPENTTLNAAKGWYDAGDFGKYTVNSGISTYLLLSAYEDFSGKLSSVNLNIPESSNTTPDILDEIKWNIDWLATMQDEDGSVYHKLTTLEWPGQIMPEDDTMKRYMIGKSTAAAYNFSAVLAKASRIYSALGSDYEPIAQTWLQQAIDAWQWGQDNPNMIYQQPSDVKSGEYGDDKLADEALWASAELFLATNDNQYLQGFDFNKTLTTPSWADVLTLSYVSLSKHSAAIDNTQSAAIKQNLLTLADSYLAQMNQSSYQVPMANIDYVWGSNSVAATKAFVLFQAYQLSQEDKYRLAISDITSYLLGVNPTGYSYVTGFGSKSPMYIHHRASDADNISEPYPGFLVGGPHSGKQDNCQYEASTPAKTYLDDWCSYATNEVAINWNAALVYLLSTQY